MTLAGSILDDDETTVSQIPGSAETSRISAKAQQTETDETEKDDKESLMQRLARSKVSPDLATARSMQLRRCVVNIIILHNITHASISGFFGLFGGKFMKGHSSSGIFSPYLQRRRLKLVNLC